MAGKEQYVFISYSSKDQQMADSVRMILLENGITCWMAPYDIPAGSKYAYVINDALENCTCLVLLLTNASQESQFVEREIERAITYRKPIIPMQLEDIQLNSGFKFYIGNSQIIAVPDIKPEASEFKKVIRGIQRYMSCDEHPSKEAHCYIAPKVDPIVQCDITIFSPVSVDVYLNDKTNMIMRLDRNRGFDYEHNTVPVPKSFNLIFVSKGFEKSIPFSVPCDNKIEYRLKPILTQAEIVASYDRRAALGQLEVEPTGYAFEQLSSIGLAEDIPKLRDIILALSNETSPDDTRTNYLIARCAIALGKLAIKYRDYEKARILIDVYDTYPAKESYGYMFEDVMKKLLRALRTVQTHQSSYCNGSNSEQELKWSFSEETGTLCLSGAGPMPDYYRPDPQTPWKKYKDKIKTVLIENGITEIGMHAFWKYPILQTIVLPASVTDIRPYAFEGCRMLVSVELVRTPYLIENYTEKENAPVDSIVFWKNALAGTRWAAHRKLYDTNL